MGLQGFVAEIEARNDLWRTAGLPLLDIEAEAGEWHTTRYERAYARFAQSELALTHPLPPVPELEGRGRSCVLLNRNDVVASSRFTRVMDRMAAD